MFDFRSVSAISSLSAAVIVIAATSVSAAPLVIHEIQLGDPNGGVNCGSGRHSLNLGPGVTEFYFDDAGPYGSPCPNGNDANPPSLNNLGELNDLYVGPIATSLGDIEFTAGDTDADVVTGLQGGQSGQPWADNSPYLVIAGIGHGSTGSVTVDISDTNSNFFGLYWGSIDVYNTITFGMSDNTSQAFTGTQIIGGIVADGNQFSVDSNAYIGWLVTGATIDSVTLSTTQRAIEVDNFAFGFISVPAPGALALLGFGLLGLGMRRRTA